MSTSTLFLDTSLYTYMCQHSLREPELLAQLRQETATLKDAVMQITPEQGQFMGMITRLMGARRAIEVGTFTGYSTLSVAMALPDDGELIACDVSDAWTSIAKRYWQQAGQADKIALHLAPAVETLDRLIAEGREGEFDIAFIDADKANYQNYFERCLRLLRHGGVILIDNVFWGGAVVNSADNSDETRAIRALNQALKDDPRVEISIVPIGDGLTLARKRC